jgi:hypothetical protein
MEAWLALFKEHHKPEEPASTLVLSPEVCMFSSDIL